MSIKQLLLFFGLSFFQFFQAQIRLPKLINDGMVLQREVPIQIWGWAAPSEAISIKFIEKTYQTQANSNGEWQISLPSLPHGGPYKMILKASNTIELKNILIGDVWVASGQSNMAYEVLKSKRLYSREIQNAKNPYIRHFLVPKEASFNEEKMDLKSGNWKSLNPNNIEKFSAVAHFFAEKIYDENQIPVGIINSSLGGSPAQAWMTESALKSFPEYYAESQKMKNKFYVDSIELKNKSLRNEWLEKANKTDLGLQKNWIATDYEDSNWSDFEVPGLWLSKIGYKQGVFWFRKKVFINDFEKQSPAVLNLGRISDADQTYINGQLLGRTAHKYLERNYDIPEGILIKGENVIAVRVLSYRFNGGFLKGMRRNLTLGNKSYDLNNDWKFNPGTIVEMLPKPYQLHWASSGLYKHMIAPLTNFPIKGVIWYQGEGNVKNAAEYDRLFPALISDWREQWGQGDFPFLFVQLANYMKQKQSPTQSGWARLREAQSKTLDLNNTAMGITIDIGDANDIHPKNKKDVGYRLASQAQRLVYNQQKGPNPPAYKAMKVIDGKIKITFSNPNSIDVKDGTLLKNFAIAAKDKKFVWAKAKYHNNEVIVWNDAIDVPIAVRYAWADNPGSINFYDIEGMPVSPFRTDEW